MKGSFPLPFSCLFFCFFFLLFSPLFFSSQKHSHNKQQQPIANTLHSCHSTLFLSPSLTTTQQKSTQEETTNLLDVHLFTLFGNRITQTPLTLHNRTEAKKKRKKTFPRSKISSRGFGLFVEWFRAILECFSIGF